MTKIVSNRDIFFQSTIIMARPQAQTQNISRLTAKYPPPLMIRVNFIESFVKCTMLVYVKGPSFENTGKY